MKKRLLVIFVVLLLVIVGMWFYQTRPLAIDGSTPERFEASLKRIEDALDEDEKLQFQRDLEAVDVLNAVEDRKVMERLALARLLPDAKAEPMAREILFEPRRKRLDGKTLQDVRQLAEQGRTKGNTVFASLPDRNRQPSAQSQSRSTTKPNNASEKAPQQMWGTFDELLAAAPQTQLVTREIELNDTSCLIDLPEDAQIEPGLIGDGFNLQLVTGELATSKSGSWDMSHLRRVNREGAFRGQDAIVFADSTLFLERLNPRNGLGNNAHKAMMNVTLGQWREFAVRIEAKDPQTRRKKALGLESTLLLVRCLRSLRLSTPDPQAPVELLDGLRIEYAPDSASQADEVTELQFPVNATTAQFRVLELFPNLESVTIPGRNLSDTGRDELAPLKTRPNLKRLALEISLQDSSIGTVFGLTRLKELDMRVRKPEQIEHIGKLPELKRLNLDISGNDINHINALSSCRMLTSLHIKLSIRGATPESGLEFLRELPQLRELSLAGNLNSEAVLKTLGKLQHLESLDLALMTTDGSTLSHLSGATALTTLSLNLSEATFGPRDLASLAGAPIEHFTLKSRSHGNNTAAINDETLASLSELKSLHELDLDVKTVTLSGLDVLSKLPNLKKVTLHTSKLLTREDIDRFHAAHRNLAVQTSLF